MKKSILATTILLLISVSLILLTFGISERIAIINYNNESTQYKLDEDNKFRRIDMYNPAFFSYSKTYIRLRFSGRFGRFLF